LLILTIVDWDRFVDDPQDNDESLLQTVFPKYDEMDDSILRRDPAFLTTLWQRRNELTGCEALFEEFDHNQRAKRERLATLESTLSNDLTLTCTTTGRDETSAVNSADIVFIDLFLG
jgi:hypothetical protein